MSEKRVVMVVDMQNGVFETPRHQREKRVSPINQLTHAAEAPVLINHYNDVWRNFIAPANLPAVKRVETILENWKAN